LALQEGNNCFWEKKGTLIGLEGVWPAQQIARGKMSERGGIFIKGKVRNSGEGAGKENSLGSKEREKRII